MDLIEVFKTRKSIRKFRNEDVDAERLIKIIEVSANAPSGSNAQNWFVYIIKSRDVLSRMKNEAASVYKKLIGKDAPGVITFFGEATAVLAVVAKPYIGGIDDILEKSDKNRSYERKFIVNPGLQGVSSLITHILLACHNDGLGACWMTGPLIAKEEMENIIGIKKPDNLVALIPVGIPVERTSKTSRKDVSEIIKVL